MQIIRTIPAPVALSAAFTILWGVADPVAAYAEVVEIEAEGRYPGGMQETPQEMQEQALERAKQAAAEQAGVYVESHTEVENGVLTKDMIRSLAASVLEITRRDFRMVPLADGKTIEMVCTIKARVDIEKIRSADLAAKGDQLEKIAEQNKRIKELEAEAERLKVEIGTLSAAQKEKAEAQLSENRRQSLIAIYEKNLDVYDLSRQPNMEELLETANKLTELDPQNPTALRAVMYYYRSRQEYQNVVRYGERLLAANPSPEMAIEICTQLGSAYAYDLRDEGKALEYVNKGIVLARQKYSKAEIEAYVNGSEVTVEDFKLTGKTNTLRELYVMKSALEDENPSFVCETVVRTAILESYRIYNVKYRTDWTGTERSTSHAAVEKLTETEFLEIRGDNHRLERGKNSMDIIYGLGESPKGFSKDSVGAKIYAYQAARLEGLIRIVKNMPGDTSSVVLGDVIRARISVAQGVLNYAHEVGVRYELANDGSLYCRVYMAVPVDYSK